jgi:hypothetical protein
VQAVLTVSETVDEAQRLFPRAFTQNA